MAKSKTVHRVFERYTSEDRANHAASHRLGYLQRQAVGQFYYVSELVPNIAFPTRSRAEEAERQHRETAAQLRINEKYFRAEPWRETQHDGKRIWISTCHELIAGRWEGFVAMSFEKPKEMQP